MKYLKSILSIFIALVIVLSTITAPRALTSDEIETQIQQLKEEKEQLKEQLDNLQTQKEENQDKIVQLMADKAIIDQEIQLLSLDIENTNKQIMNYNMLIADKQGELEVAQKNLAELNQKYKERIRAMEESGKISFWSVIFRARSFSDLLDRMHMIEEIAEADNQRMKELADAAQVVQDAQDALKAEKQNLETVKAELDAAQATLNQKKEDSNKLLQELLSEAKNLDELELSFEERERDFLEEIAQMEVEYNEAKQREWEEYLQSLIPPEPEPEPEQPDPPKETQPDEDKEETQPTEPEQKPTEPEEEPEDEKPQEPEKPAFDNSKWYVPCSYVKLTSPFGYRDAPTAGASTYHQGVDLAGPAGTPIYATRGGQVIFAGYGSAAGNYVQLDHLDGYRSVYMHLTNYVVKNGQFVAPGELIGYMGSTGVSTGPHLHFGISYNGTYVNPCEFLDLAIWG